MPIKYTNQFKKKCVTDVMNSSKSMQELSKFHNIKLKTLYTWVADYKKKNNINTRSIIETRKKINSDKSSLETFDNLKQENLALKKERDILMDIAAYIVKNV